MHVAFHASLRYLFARQRALHMAVAWLGVEVVPSPQNRGNWGLAQGSTPGHPRERKLVTCSIARIDIHLAAMAAAKKAPRAR
jgi:hypothetical protein